MNSSTLLGTSAVPIIVAIIQALKTAGLPVKLSAIAAIILGLTAGILSVMLTTTGTPTTNHIAAAAVLGLTWGLSASGLYEVGRTTLNALNTDPNPYGPPRQPIQAGQPLGDLPKKPLTTNHQPETRN